MKNDAAFLCVLLAMSGLSTGCTSEKATETTASLNAVTWTYGPLVLQADDFFLDAAGVRFYAPDSNLVVTGDTAGTLWTLELEWDENNTDMRLYIYLEADSANWWSYEMRTYDTALGDGTQWVYYYGEFFKSPIGSTFVGDLDLTNDDSDNLIAGRLYFRNVRFRAF